MSVLKTKIVVSVIVAITIIGFAVVLIGPLNPVQSFSVVAVDGEASPLAAFVSQVMFAALTITGVGVVAWFSFCIFKRGKDDDRGHR